MAGSAEVRQEAPGKERLLAGRGAQFVDRASFVLLILALVYWAAFVLVVLPATFRGQPSDFISYYAAALALRQHAGAQIYDLTFLRQVMAGSPCAGSFGPYAYPPTLAILLQPLTLLPCNVAAGGWLLFNVALWLASALLLASFLPSLLPEVSAQRGRWLKRGSIVLCLIAVPLIDALILGQINFIVLFALVLIPWLIQRDKPLLAGFALALIAVIKLVPAFLLLYFVIRGRWRVVLGAALGGALFVGLTVVSIGVPATLESLVPLLAWGPGVDPPHNEALAQLPLWLTLAGGGQPDQVTRDVMLLLAGLVALAFVAGVVVMLRLHQARPAWRVNSRLEAAPQRPPARPATNAGLLDRRAGPAALEEVLGYGWAICTMMLLAPLVWFHYNGWLLAPLLCCVGVTLGWLPGGQGRRWVIAGLLAVAALCTLFPLPFDVDNMGTHAQTPVVLGVPLWLPLLLTRPVGTLLLWGVLYWLWRRVYRAAHGLMQ